MREDIFIFDNLNNRAVLYNNEKESEFYNRHLYIRENEGYKMDRRQWKYFISFSQGGQAFAGIGADGIGSTFNPAPRMVNLMHENGKYKLTIGNVLNVVVRKLGKFRDDYMEEDGFEVSDDGKFRKIYSYAGEN